MQNDFDVAVVGLGGAGLSAVRTLSERGHSVLGLEQFSEGHEAGSSHADSRLFRLAYFEGEDYVPILKFCYQQWCEWNQRSSEPLFVQTGLHLFGSSDDAPIVQGSLASAQKHQIAVRKTFLQEAQKADWWRCFAAVDNAAVSVFEERAGYLWAARTLTFLAEMAKSHGASLCYQQRLLAYQSDAHGVTLQLAGGQQFRVGKLVLCPGVWLGACVKDTTCRVEQNAHLWWRLADFQPQQCWAYDTPLGFFYGMPSLDGRSVKINRHGGGRPCTDPSLIDAEVSEALIASVRQFIERYLPGQQPELLASKPCLYTYSKDEDFYIDLIDERILLIGGLSGHGFKFLPAFGLAARHFVEGYGKGDPVIVGHAKFRLDR